MYVNYEFYRDTFGGTIPAERFPAIEAKAEANIRYFTYVNGNIFAAESDCI